MEAKIYFGSFRLKSDVHYPVFQSKPIKSLISVNQSNPRNQRQKMK